MAGSLNKATIIGHLGRDPEIRSTQTGDKVCNLSVATSESWKSKHTGERQEKTEWHRCTVWGDGLVDAIGKYLHKGSKIFLEGKIETRKWQDQSGNDRYSTEIIVQGFGGKIIFLDSAKSQDQQSSGGTQSAYQGANEKHQEQYGGDLDDAIPFAACKLI